MTGALVAIIGWSAAVLILASYVLLSLDRISSRSIAYQAMNVVGAAGFIVNSGYNGAMPSAVLNIVWMAIGLYAIARLLRRRPAARQAPSPLQPGDLPPG